MTIPAAPAAPRDSGRPAPQSSRTIKEQHRDRPDHCDRKDHPPVSMNGIDPEETAETLERDPRHQGAADLIRQMAARIAELEAQAAGTGPASARLLDCGLCYEEQGEEIHPHPECPIGAAPAAAPSAPTNQTALRDRIAAAIWERQNPGRRWADCEYRWRADAEADADTVLAVLPAPGDRAAILREAADELWALANRLTERGRGVLWAAERLRRMAGEAQQPETQAAADCPYGEGPGDGSGCIKPAGHDGDHVVTSGVAVVPCSRAVLHQPHIPHVWWPQPGMAYVQCPGRSVDTAAVSRTVEARQADTAGEQE